MQPRAKAALVGGAAFVVIALGIGIGVWLSSSGSSSRAAGEAAASKNLGYAMLWKQASIGRMKVGALARVAQAVPALLRRQPQRLLRVFPARGEGEALQSLLQERRPGFEESRLIVVALRGDRRLFLVPRRALLDSVRTQGMPLCSGRRNMSIWALVRFRQARQSLLRSVVAVLVLVGLLVLGVGSASAAKQKSAATAASSAQAPVPVSIYEDPSGTRAGADSVETIRFLGDGKYQLEVQNTSDIGYLNTFEWHPPPGMTVTAVTSAEGRASPAS